MAPKLILADLDGTLLDEKKHLTPRSRAALERSAASGAQVVIDVGEPKDTIVEACPTF